MNNNTVPYVYLVGWADLDKYYIGVQFRKNYGPKDFWVRYFTSSKEVPKFREKHGEPDVLVIIREHKNAKDAVEHEDKLLRRLNAVKSDRFLNRARGGVEWNMSAISDETRAKMSKPRLRLKRRWSDEAIHETTERLAKHVGVVFSNKTKDRMYKAMAKEKRGASEEEKVSRAKAVAQIMFEATNKRVVSDETKAKRSKAATGRVFSDETKAKISATKLGHEVSAETRAKMSAAARARKGQGSTYKVPPLP